MARLSALGIREEQLEESFIHASGKGGQNVNKVSTAVRLREPHSNLTVKCMTERTQMLNRIKAREILAEKIERIKEKERLRIRTLAEKRRREKQKRPQTVKMEILRQKRLKSEKKKSRAWRPLLEE
jgi:protein subunit release factor B